MSSELKSSTSASAAAHLHRGRGRPRVDSVRVECCIPRSAYEQLLRTEKLTGVSRTRVAAVILVTTLSGSDAAMLLKRNAQNAGRPQ